MKFVVLSFALGLGIMVLPLCVWAVSDDFTISTIIGSDTQAPTTPTLLSVTPVASTQIDITWSAATDDVFVAGYRLFRNSVQIATTTLLSYSDTGLTPSTTYSYTVDAFDTYNNFSSSSASLATTTLPLPPPIATSTPTTTNTGNGGTRTAVTLENISIITTQTSAQFNWQTSGKTQYTLVWGRTLSYELGSVSGIVFGEIHQTNITQLEPGTRYFYELRATDVRGVTRTLSADSFTTQSAMTTGLLPNVDLFIATVQSNDVRLAWKSNFSNPNYYVRVVRSHLFYPTSIQNGAVVYEGRAESFVDVKALSLRSPQYYTIFVLDGSGAVSSGAVARADRDVKSDAGATGTLSIIPPDIGDDTILRAGDISILQNDSTQQFDEGINLTLGMPYTVRIPYSSVPKNLKSIIVSVQNPTNQKEISSYLLKLNKEGDAYEANLPAPATIGVVQIMVELFDYEQATVRRVSTSLTFSDAREPIPFFPDRLFMYGTFILWLLLLAGFLFWLILLWRRRTRAS